MKPLLAALLLSFAANGVLLHRRYHSVDDRPSPPSFPATPAIAIISFDENSPGGIDEAWKLSAGEGPNRFADRLRAAGVPARLVRALVTAAIDEEFRARETALRPPPKKTKFWQTDAPPPLPFQSRLALLDLQREKAKLRIEILGPDPAAEADRSYAQLPAAKRELAKAIVEDYGAMLTNLRDQSRQLPLPSECEQIAFLEAQRRRDLAEVLSPDEVADLERRNSPIAGRVRHNLKFFDATPAEFQTIFDAEAALIPIKDMLSKSNAASIALPPEVAREKVAEKDRLQDELKAALGDVRYAKYERAQDSDYPRLADLSLRAGLPPGTTDRAFDLRDQIAADSLRIASDDTLDLDQKRAALKTLAENSRARLDALLGSEASAAFSEQSEKLFRQLERGRYVVFGENGTSIVDIDP